MINLKILIDADGCPVTRLAVNTAKEYNIESVIFCDTSHIFKDIDAKTVTVSQGADSADFALVNTVEKNENKQLIQNTLNNINKSIDMTKTSFYGFKE